MYAILFLAIFHVTHHLSYQWCLKDTGKIVNNLYKNIMPFCHCMLSHFTITFYKQGIMLKLWLCASKLNKLFCLGTFKVSSDWFILFKNRPPLLTPPPSVLGPGLPLDSAIPTTIHIAANPKITTNTVFAIPNKNILILFTSWKKKLLKLRHADCKKKSHHWCCKEERKEHVWKFRFSWCIWQARLL